MIHQTEEPTRTEMPEPVLGGYRLAPLAAAARGRQPPVRSDGRGRQRGRRPGERRAGHQPPCPRALPPPRPHPRRARAPRAPPGCWRAGRREGGCSWPRSGSRSGRWRASCGRAARSAARAPAATAGRGGLDAAQAAALCTGRSARTACCSTARRRSSTCSGCSPCRQAGWGDVVRTDAHLHYESPEGVRGEELDAASNVYSLTGLLVHALTGQEPFAHHDPMMITYAHVSQPPPKPSERRPELPAALDALVARGMAKEPGERPASAGALIAGAETALRTRRRPSRPRRARASRGRRRSSGRPTQRCRPSRRRRATPTRLTRAAASRGADRRAGAPARARRPPGRRDAGRRARHGPDAQDRRAATAPHRAAGGGLQEAQGPASREARAVGPDAARHRARRVFGALLGMPAAAPSRRPSTRAVGDEQRREAARRGPLQAARRPGHRVDTGGAGRRGRAARDGVRPRGRRRELARAGLGGARRIGSPTRASQSAARCGDEDCLRQRSRRGRGRRVVQVGRDWRKSICRSRRE